MTANTANDQPVWLPRVVAALLILGAAAGRIVYLGWYSVLDLAPDEARRPVYIGMNDTLVALPTMLLVARARPESCAAESRRCPGSICSILCRI